MRPVPCLPQSFPLLSLCRIPLTCAPVSFFLPVQSFLHLSPPTRGLTCASRPVFFLFYPLQCFPPLSPPSRTLTCGSCSFSSPLQYVPLLLLPLKPFTCASSLPSCSSSETQRHGGSDHQAPPPHLGHHGVRESDCRSLGFWRQGGELFISGEHSQISPPPLVHLPAWVQWVRGRSSGIRRGKEE